MARKKTSEEPILPGKCLKCGGPLQVHAFDDVRVSVGNSEPMKYPAAFYPKCKIVYFPIFKYKGARTDKKGGGCGGITSYA